MLFMYLMMTQPQPSYQLKQRIYLIHLVDCSLLTDEKENSSSKISGDTKGESLFSNISRNSQKSKMCKMRDNFTCILCRYFTNITALINASHIYGIEEHLKVETKNRAMVLLELNIDSINNVSNLLTFCIQCHKNFDDQYIGIVPETKTWIIAPFIFDQQSTNNTVYRTFHETPVIFSMYPPPLILLQHRFDRFVAAQAKITAPLCTVLVAKKKES